MLSSTVCVLIIRQLWDIVQWHFGAAVYEYANQHLFVTTVHFCDIVPQETLWRQRSYDGHGEGYTGGSGLCKGKGSLKNLRKISKHGLNHVKMHNI